MGVFRWLRRRKRARIAERAFPPAWEEHVSRNLPYWDALPREDRSELLRHVLVFLAEKRFEGCAGLELTEEMRLTIAAQACVLLLHRDTDYFPEVDSILVYPEPFRAPVVRSLGGGAVLEDDEERSGESWQQGTVILAWNEILQTAEGPGDGFNVIYHEFAHELDREDGEMNGVPLLVDRAARADWTRVFSKEFRRLLEESRQAGNARRKRQLPLLDEYGAEDPGEFFAVATETFFELPLDLRDEHPELYDQLRKFYRQDPAALWERVRRPS